MTEAAHAAATGVATIATPNAEKYLIQLCKHFAHKIPAEYGDGAGHISFEAGDCRLAARDGALIVTVTASDAAGLERVEDVVARHLRRFAFREELAIDWGPKGE